MTTRIEQRITINRTPDVVWDFMLNPFNSPRWFGDMIAVRFPTAGEPGVGSIGHARMSILGFETRLTFTFTQWERPQFAAYTIAGRPFRSASRRVLLSKAPGGTEVTFTTEFDLRPWLRPLALVIWPIMRRRWAARNRRLKEIVEASPS